MTIFTDNYFFNIPHEPQHMWNNCKAKMFIQVILIRT